VTKSVRCADFGTWHDRYEERRNAYMELEGQYE